MRRLGEIAEPRLEDAEIMWDPKRADWEARYFSIQREPAYMEGVAAQIADFGINAAGCDVLDAGCGPGAYLHLLLAHGPKSAVGLDISPFYMRKLRDTEQGARFARASVDRLPFRNDSFDLILLLNTLLHVNATRTLDEARRVLRPRGVLWVSHNLPGYYWWKLRYRNGRPWKTYAVETLSSIKRLAEPVFGCSRRSPYTSRSGFAQLLKPLRVEKESFIVGDGIPCQIVVMARKIPGDS